MSKYVDGQICVLLATAYVFSDLVMWTRNYFKNKDL